MKIYVNGIGLQARGMTDWPTAEPVLTGGAPFDATTVPRPVGDILPAGERRRSSPVIKLAVQAAREAVERAAMTPESLAVVFASSSGDADTIHHICEALATPQREVSPTRFHNSVHNAPAGYWSIATGSRQPSTSVSGWDDTFAMGLLESALQATVEAVPVLLAGYDVPFPAPLSAVFPATAPFGVALVVAPTPSATSVAELSLALGDPGAPVTVMADPALEALRGDTAAGRSLPLLAALAARRPAHLVLRYANDRSLQIETRPWG